MDRNPDALGLAAQLLDRVGIHVGKQLRQHLEDRDLGACAGIDVAELQRDYAAADKGNAFRQSALAQHIIGGDHQLGTVKWQPARRRAGGDHDVLGFQGLAAGRNRVRADEAGALADHFDTASVH
jgi:hypothetical protein